MRPFFPSPFLARVSPHASVLIRYCATLGTREYRRLRWRSVGSNDLGTIVSHLSRYELVVASSIDPTSRSRYSAGGISVASQMTAYGGRNDNLFRGAMIDSGVFAASNASLESQAPAWSKCTDTSLTLSRISHEAHKFLS